MSRSFRSLTATCALRTAAQTVADRPDVALQRLGKIRWRARQKLVDLPGENVSQNLRTHLLDVAGLFSAFAVEVAHGWCVAQPILRPRRRQADRAVTPGNELRGRPDLFRQTVFAGQRLRQRLVDQPLDFRVGDGGALLPDLIVDERDGDGQVFALLVAQRRPRRAAIDDGVVPIEPDAASFSPAALTVRRAIAPNRHRSKTARPRTSNRPPRSVSARQTPYSGRSVGEGAPPSASSAVASRKSCAR